jgi:hypothetical protein
MKEFPFMAIEVIEERDDLRIVSSLVAEPLTDRGPIFLFDMSVVIFVVGTRNEDYYDPCGLHLLFCTPR